MRPSHLTRRFLAGLLTLIGFSACTKEQPDLYGTPLLYGPLPVDSTEMNQPKEAPSHPIENIAPTTDKLE